MPICVKRGHFMHKSFIYFILSILLFLMVIVTNWTIQIKNEKMPAFDEWTRPYVHLVAETKVYTVFRWITELGSFHIVFPFTIVMMLIFWIFFKDYLPSCLFGTGVLITYLINQLLKQIITRERPSMSVLLNAEGYSFPSGHSMITVVCYGLVAFFIGLHISSNKQKIILYMVAGSIIVSVGLSRYILNVHFLTDIVSGFLFGSIILFGFIHLYKTIMNIRT